jgi:diaminohydroxyphosphoribosylaminopyrimidine deaminase/5-amino-6-(5-phosphoribosylamino)uracil reductase
MTLNIHEKYMCRCIKLAQSSAGYTAPNPMVGCVIVHDGQIIGEGRHQRYGEPHAEVNAIRAVREKDLLPCSTLYVNLEPCAHHGKTPPCVDQIIAHHIPQVIIGSSDPNPKVSGKGVDQLRAANCMVTEHVMAEACDQLNRRFLTFHRLHRPYVALKWAQTADGFVDIIRNECHDRRPTWITGDYERTLVHKWRSEESAIMVGTNTALLDNPKLNLRQWQGQAPLRIVLDRNLSLPASLHLFDGTQPTLVFTEQPAGLLPHIAYAVVPFDCRLPARILAELCRRNILSVLIEGGTQLLQSFINAKLWDEARVFTGNISFDKGVKAPVLNAPVKKTYHLPNSVLRLIENN